ncbi:MAG: CDP-alcohol phosphatidyltransferase family protein [Planctomycetes bacterium]|nr:CDP-alcohol phosphatidyltransferase family protein [Planctomycetota bacterium]
MSQSYLYLWRALNWPNRISLLRVLGVAPFVMLLLKQEAWPPARHVALAVFVGIALSDAADGYLARRLNQSTRLGKILDPLADKLLITCSVFLLASSAAAVPGVKLPGGVVVAVVGKDLWVVLGFLVLFLITGEARVQPTLAGKLCTMTQLVMVAGVLIAPDLNAVAARAGTILAALMAWTVVGMCILSVMSYTRLGVVFLAEAGEAPSVEETHKQHEAKKAQRAARRARRRPDGH